MFPPTTTIHLYYYQCRWHTVDINAVRCRQLHFFSHENQSYPPSLSNYGALRSGTKADLLVCVSELVLHHDTVKPHEAHMVILDGDAIFNMIKPRTPVTLNLQPRKHLSSEHFKSLGWLPIEQRVEQLKLNHVYRVLGGIAPTYLSGRLTLNNHSHNTRSSQSSLVIPHHGTYGKSVFCITGAKLWNSLPASSPSLVNFKKKVKVFYMTKWFQSSGMNLFCTSQSNVNVLSVLLLHLNTFVVFTK